MWKREMDVMMVVEEMSGMIAVCRRLSAAVARQSVSVYICDRWRRLVVVGGRKSSSSEGSREGS
jgi:hypothetical protein